MFGTDDSMLTGSSITALSMLVHVSIINLAI
jgi:hypothetical protein